MKWALKASDIPPGLIERTEAYAKVLELQRNIEDIDLVATRCVLLRIGAKRFGNPDIHTVLFLSEADDFDRLDELICRLPLCSSWRDLTKQSGPAQTAQMESTKPNQS